MKNSVTGFFTNEIGEFDKEDFEKFRLSTGRESLFYSYPWKSGRDLFIKIEKVPAGFATKPLPYLKQLTACNSPYVTRYYDMLTFPQENQIFPGSECLLTVTEKNNASYLGDHLKEKDPMDKDFRVLIIRMLKGFSALHKCGIMHGDISVNNILLHEEYNSLYPRIIDVNLFKAINNDLLFVSPEYIAPEVDHPEQYDIKAEIWAIGVLLFYLVSKRFPFKSRLDGLEADQIKHLVRQNEVNFSDIHSHVYKQVLATALSKNRADRPDSINVLLNILLNSFGFKKIFIY